MEERLPLKAEKLDVEAQDVTLAAESEKQRSFAVKVHGIVLLLWAVATAAAYLFRLSAAVVQWFQGVLGIIAICASMLAGVGVAVGYIAYPGWYKRPVLMGWLGILCVTGLHSVCFGGISALGVRTSMDKWFAPTLRLLVAAMGATFLVAMVSRLPLMSLKALIVALLLIAALLLLQLLVPMPPYLSTGETILQCCLVSIIYASVWFAVTRTAKLADQNLYILAFFVVYLVRIILATS